MIYVHTLVCRQHVLALVNAWAPSTRDKEGSSGLFQRRNIASRESGGDARVLQMKINNIVGDLRYSLGSAEALIQ